DTTREKRIVYDRMSQIQKEIVESGKLSAGPGYYEMGEGYLTLHQYPRAQEHLLKSWHEGYRRPEVAYALGLVLGHIYQEELAQKRGSKEVRDAQVHQLEQQYRDPAIQYLRQAGASKTQTPVYVSGLLALYEGSYADALQDARRAIQEIPWL